MMQKALVGQATIAQRPVNVIDESFYSISVSCTVDYITELAMQL